MTRHPHRDKATAGEGYRPLMYKRSQARTVYRHNQGSPHLDFVQGRRVGHQATIKGEQGRLLAPALRGDKADESALVPGAYLTDIYLVVHEQGGPVLDDGGEGDLYALDVALRDTAIEGIAFEYQAFFASPFDQTEGAVHH